MTVQVVNTELDAAYQRNKETVKMMLSDKRERERERERERKRERERE